jgi:DNA replication protein DnaC
VLQARFAEFGDIGTRFFEGLWQAQRHAPSQACLILELSGAYMRAGFIAAPERAVRFGAYGKSRLLEGIGRRLCALGKRVRYTTSGDLIAHLTASLADGTLPQRLSYWTHFHLLIIDEFGLDYVERKLDSQAAHLLFKVVAARNGKSLTAMGTNIEFDAWAAYLGDAPLAMALLDRVVDRAVDRAVLLKIVGKSYRAARAMPNKATKSSESTR